MGRRRQLSVSEKGLKELKNLSLHHSSPKIRQRCNIVLLNTSGETVEKIEKLLGCSKTTITYSLDRYEYHYEKEGIKCMFNKGGQGRKAALTISDTAMVREAVCQERQKVSLAKAIISENKGVELSDYQLRTFLKRLVAVTDEFVE